MPYPVEPGDSRVEALLEEDRVGTLVIRGDLANSRPGDVRLFLDDPEEPAGLLAVGWFCRIHARDRDALHRLLPAVPERHPFEPEASSVSFGGVASWIRDEILGGREPSWEHACWLYSLEDPARLPAVRHDVGELRSEDVALVSEHWPHGDDEAYVRWRIEAGPTAAIREDGALVSWAMTHGDDEMGFMTTLPAARRKGYARSNTAALSRRILERGGVPFLYTIRDNERAWRLVEAAGFERWGAYDWFGLPR
jgi:ribosomal protein S18 acetylase RimI-like enzyme